MSVLCLSSTVRAQSNESASDAGTPTAAFPAQAPDAAPPLGEPPPRPESAELPPPRPPPAETLPPAGFSAPEPGEARYPVAPASLQPASSRWYGGQTLLVDGIAIGALLAGTQTNDGAPLYVMGGLGYVFGAPIVHAAHGHVGKPFASFGLRVGMPIGGALLGSAIETQGQHCGGDFCGLAGAAIGFLVGVVGAITLDAAVIAREDVPAREAPRVGARPSFVVTRQHVGAGLAGWF